MSRVHLVLRVGIFSGYVFLLIWGHFLYVFLLMGDLFHNVRAFLLLFLDVGGLFVLMGDLFCACPHPMKISAGAHAYYSFTVHTTTVPTTVIVLTTLNVPTTYTVTVYVTINILLNLSCCSNFISFHLI